jgi:signal transduction histidine kinase
VEAGKLALQPRALSVVNTLEGVLALARGLAAKKSQRLLSEIEADLPSLRADPIRFKQICFNLLSNAVKFTPDGGAITLTARKVDGSTGQIVNSSPPIDQSTTRPIDRPGEWLEIRVTDSGIGIRLDDLSRLFQDFVQLESVETKRHEGTGLGLALTKRLVELHGGRIWAESDGEGRGSTFTVILPFTGLTEARQ